MSAGKPQRKITLGKIPLGIITSGKIPQENYHQGLMSPSNPSTKLNSVKIILGKITHRASCLRVAPAQNYPG